ncbi:MAG: hypothetical protein ACFCVK_04830 [Acidimicrobiales bacterium]
MSHMVIYRGADGKPGYQQAEDIHDAVTFVEQMRNEEGVEQARIFRLEEVVFEYKPYYRVELGNAQPVEQQLTSGSVDAALVNTGPVAVASATFAAPAPAPEHPEPIEEPVALDDSFDIVEATTINIDEHESETVTGNGARRGLFGR